MPKARNIQQTVVSATNNKSETELNEVQQNLLRFCRLLVDINFRNKLPNNLDKVKKNDYSEITIK
jgi:hypothetical protein